VEVLASCEHYTPASHMVGSALVCPFILILLTLDMLLECCATQYNSSESRNHFLACQETESAHLSVLFCPLVVTEWVIDIFPRRGFCLFH
jgi:hypothetical protein